MTAKKVAAKKVDEAPETPVVSEAPAPVVADPAPAFNPWDLPINGSAPEVVDTPVEASKHGYIGVQVDPTPNEHYTVAGQLAAMPDKG